MQKKNLWMIGALGCGSPTVLIIVAVVVVSVLMVMPNSPLTNMMTCGMNMPTGQPGVVQADAKTSKTSIPSNYFKLYREAGERWNIPWNILAGVGWVETKHGTYGASREDGPNYAGAAGPMQFKQATFDTYKVDVDGNGADLYAANDAIFSTAKMLRTQFSSFADVNKDLTHEQLKRTIFAYNHGPGAPYDPANPGNYVQNVLAQANIYANNYDLASANFVGTGACTAGLMVLQSGSFGQRIAEAAASWTVKKEGTPNTQRQTKKLIPYVWGGGGINGPTGGGFDCSGLAQYAVYKASKGKITMPRTTWDMWDSNKGVKIPRNQSNKLMPGDLVFFNNLEHMGIYFGEVNGVRWWVQAPHTGAFVRFNVFSGGGSYYGALRVTPPSVPA